MNLANLAISITAVDATHNLFGRMARNVGKLTAEVKQLWTQGQKLKASMKVISKAGTYAAGAFGGLAAATGVHQIINGLADAQEGFNKIEMLTGKTTDQMEAFKNEIYSIAAETGRGPEEILANAIDKVGEGLSDKDVFATLRKEGLYATASFSKNMGDISGATLKMSRLMKMDLDTATDAFGGIHEIMKGAGKLEFEGFMAASEGMMKNAGAIMGSKSGKGKEGALQIAAAAKIASKTMSADEATASVESFFSDLMKAKTEGTLQKVAGLDLETLKKEGEATGNAMGYIVDKLMEATKGNDLELSKLFKSEGTRDLIRSLQAERKEFDDIWQSAEKANDSQAIKDKGKAMKSIKAQWGLFRTQLTKLMNSDVAPWLDKITGALTWLTKGGKGAGAAMIALKAAFGVAVVAKGIGAIVSAVSFIASPIGLIAIAVVALVALGVVIYKNWGSIASFFKKFWGWLKTAWTAVATFFLPFIAIPVLVIKNWNKISGFFKEFWGWLKGGLSAAWNWIAGVFSRVFTLYVGIIAGIVGAVKGGLSAAWNWIAGTFAKNLSVNSGILFSGHVALEDRDESAVMGSVGRVLGEGGATDPKEGARPRKGIQAGPRRREEGEAAPPGLRGHRARAADGLPVEVAPEGGVRQLQLDTQVFPRLGEGGLLHGDMEGRAGGVRRDGGHSVELAEHRRGHGEGSDGKGGGGAQPHRQGKKMGASGTSWWPGVGSCCRSS